MAEITPHDRGQALAELERIAHTLTQMSEWLGNAGEERTAAMLEEALKNVVAAGWLLQRNPARTAALPPGQAPGPNWARNRPEGAHARLTHAPRSAELSIASRAVALRTASSRVAPWAVPSATERRKLYASMTLRSS